MERYRRLLDRNSTVLILSDRWDAGVPKILEEAIRQLRKHAHRGFWLLPGRAGDQYAQYSRRPALFLDKNFCAP